MQGCHYYDGSKQEHLNNFDNPPYLINPWHVLIASNSHHIHIGFKFWLIYYVYGRFYSI